MKRMKWWVFVRVQSYTCTRNVLKHTPEHWNSKYIQLELTYCFEFEQMRVHSGAQDWCSVSHSQIKETRCAHKEMLSWWTHSLWWTKKRNESVHQFKAEKSWCGVSQLANEREKMCAQGNIIMMHSHPVMYKGETRVCTSSKQRRVGAVWVTCK